MIKEKLQRLVHEEDGQALLWGTGAIVMIVALFYGALDIGQLVLGKIQAQNAADAAAMSASALKASVHNTRSVAYRATTGQVHLTRLQLIRATGLALQEVGGKAVKRKDFDEALSLAYGHRAKVERLRYGIAQFNAWVTDEKVGPRLTQQAAQIGYLGNLGSLWNADRSNLDLMASKEALVENSKKSRMIDGNPMTAEALNRTGHAGMSYAEVTPRTGAFGFSMLGSSARTELRVGAMAGPVEAAEIYGGTSRLEKKYGIHWFTVRLMPIGTDSQWKQ